MSSPELSLVIPTFNERGSIGPLLSALGSALADTTWEAIFVDDSTDGTELVIEAYVAADKHVRLLHRDVNRGGLAGAVVEGLAIARGTYIGVLDADLQHPPERIPDLLRAAREQSADVVVASRYVPGGSTGGLDGPLRQFYSRGLKSLSRTVFPRRLAQITDPLGGYFLVHRNVVEGVELRPIGYKILLEILIRCEWDTAAEVPYRFQPRQFDASKADFRQGLRFLKHLGTLAWDCSPALGIPRMLSGGAPRARPATAGSRVL
jgi:dolichol-phosphate mannosyltransferase